MVGDVVPFGRRKKASKMRRAGSKILLVGTPLQTRPVEISLADLEASLDAKEWHDRFPDEIDASTAAVILIEPLPKISLIRATKHLQDTLGRNETALFAIVGEGLVDLRARKIYDAGATAVFEWPREARLLPRLVAEMLAIELVRGKTRASDRALNRSIEARLKSTTGLGRGIRVDSHDGIVSLSGSVESLWRSKKLEEVISRIPGVKGVVSRHLRVPPTGLSDRSVAHKTRSVLQNTSGIDTSTISVSVENGTVILAGSAGERSELVHINKVASGVKGVRDLKSLVTVSRSQKEKDRIVARRVNKVVSELFPREDVSVSVFGGVAVVSGSVDLLRTKGDIEEVVGEDRAVGHVINKITID